MKTAINQLIKWIWLDFYPSELISVEQMNKIESQAKNLEPEKEHIIKAFNSGRLGRNGMDKTAEEYFDETLKK
jgi:hypothetical protein